MYISPQQILQLQTEILSWYDEHKRDLPWRRTRDPYRILVSEIMLQQTQVARVIPKFEAWLEEFPTVEKLSMAKTSEVLRMWSGLGYNRRALYLQKAAKEIVSVYKGVWPRDVAGLKKLPGIGTYTAGAVACFAFDQQLAVVDTNIRKVILLKLGELDKSGHDAERIREKDIQEIADSMLPEGDVLRLPSGRLLKASAYEWNQALMDYAAIVLKKEKIAIPKQSVFKGSNRYYRGKVLRVLLHNSPLSLKQLKREMEEDQKLLDSVVFTQIITGLVRDELALVTGEQVRLP